MVETKNSKREFNLLLAGDGAVGKTSLLNRYFGKEFTDVHMATLGMDINSSDEKDKKGVAYNIKYWDTAG